MLVRRIRAGELREGLPCFVDVSCEVRSGEILLFNVGSDLASIEEGLELFEVAWKARPSMVENGRRFFSTERHEIRRHWDDRRRYANGGRK